ncbi:hypothetical protein ALP34_200011 [Pseudomonas savastanoi pv. glycinea]|nr:hypothetical protein ALP34_200011 [Pseudomonas savastanoi pv. glycinea]
MLIFSLRSLVKSMSVSETAQATVFSAYMDNAPRKISTVVDHPLLLFFEASNTPLSSRRVSTDSALGPVLCCSMACCAHTPSPVPSDATS